MAKLDSVCPKGARNVVFRPDAYAIKDLTVCFVAVNGTWKAYNFQAIVKKFNFSDKQIQILVCRIIDTMLAHWATPKVRQVSRGGIWASAMLAVKTYLIDDNERFKKVLAATIVYCGGYAKDPVELLSAIFSREEISKIERTKEDKDYMYGFKPCNALQIIIDYVTKYFTIDELNDLWKQMLEMRYRRGFLTSCITEWWKDIKFNGKYIDSFVVGGVSRWCLVRDLNSLPSDYQNVSFVEQGILPIISEWRLRMLEGLACRCWGWCKSEDGREYFKELLVGYFANGRAAMASIILARLGSYFHYCSFEVTLCELKEFNESLSLFICGAIERAVENKNFGVATALAEHLGDYKRADKLRKDARRLNQRIALDFIFYTRGEK